MYSDGQAHEVFLHPGEIYFGDRTSRIRTVLGSCVSLVFWHSQQLLGGMCHFMLPTRHSNLQGKLDGRYADEAMMLVLEEMARRHTRPGEYKVKMFGGGNMFPAIGQQGKYHVGTKNVEMARMLIQKYKLNCVSEHVAGFGYRKLSFDVWSGVIAVTGAPMLGPQPGDVLPTTGGLITGITMDVGSTGCLPSK